jgi:hypothetical protein
MEATAVKSGGNDKNDGETMMVFSRASLFASLFALTCFASLAGGITPRYHLQQDTAYFRGVSVD